jgi:glycosyltransferase involved in cell wall biosynthesis
VAAVGLARALHARPDIEVTGLTARHRTGPPDHLDAGVPTVSSRLPRAVLYELWHRLHRPVVDRLTGYPDLVHATGGAVPATDLPLVATIHDLAWRHHPEVATLRGHRMFEAWLSDARRADRVVCPSEATRSDLLEAGFADHQVVVIPLGADPVAAAPDLAAELRARHGLDGPVVLWVGTVEPRKNLPVLARAVASLDLDGLTLVVVGPTGWREDLSAAVAPLGDGVVVTGPVDEPTKHAWFDAADVFCFPACWRASGSRCWRPWATAHR